MGRQERAIRSHAKRVEYVTIGGGCLIEEPSLVRARDTMIVGGVAVTLALRDCIPPGQ